MFIKKKNFIIHIIEDSAHALESSMEGFRSGKWSTAAIFSFYATKNITCGEGGAIATNDNELAQKLRKLKSFGLSQTALEKYKSKKLGEIDNRGSHFYVALYWAQEIGKQDEDKELQDKFLSIYKKLLAAEQSITDELLSAQGQTIDLGGYYDTQKEKVKIAMRPSPTFTTIIDEII